MYNFTTNVQLRCGKLCLKGGQFCGEVSGLQRRGLTRWRDAVRDCSRSELRGRRVIGRTS